MLDIHSQAVFADYFVICSGESEPQLRVDASGPNRSQKKATAGPKASKATRPTAGYWSILATWLCTCSQSRNVLIMIWNRFGTRARGRQNAIGTPKGPFVDEPATGACITRVSSGLPLREASLPVHRTRRTDLSHGQRFRGHLNHERGCGRFLRRNPLEWCPGGDSCVRRTHRRAHNLDAVFAFPNHGHYRARGNIVDKSLIEWFPDVGFIMTGSQLSRNLHEFHTD